MVDITAFKKTFNGDIVEPTDPSYEEAIARWASNSAKKARYVFFPKDEAAVSAAVKFATSNNIPLAIKGGGHNASGASSVEDGINIDLNRYFNTAKVDPEKKLVYVGGGALWGTVDKAVIAHGLATPGGTVNHTGVGGLILGGGYGWLSGQHGLVIDNLAQATVVIADGSIVTASDSSHPDLFWGIRGGGCNFGIVTEFVLRLHPQRKTVCAGMIIFPPPMLPKIAELVDGFDRAENEGMMIILTRGPDRKPAVIMFLFYNGSEAEGRSRFKPFFDLGPVADTVAEVPFESLNGLINFAAAPGRRYYMSGTSLRSPMVANAIQAFERMVATTETHPTDPKLPACTAMIGYEFLPLQKVCSVPADATAFRSRGPQPNIVISISWDNEEEGGADVEYARKIARELKKIIEDTATKTLAEDENEYYANYVTDVAVKPQEVHGLYGNNYPRLQEIKKKYDPNMVFNRWMPIVPAA